jgi:hypothetical protein
MEAENPPPWLAGWRAAKANFLAGSVVPLAMLAILIAYYLHPPTKEFLEHMAEVKVRWGFFYTAMAGIVAGALIPEILRVAVFQKGRFTRKNLSNLFFTAPFWCGMVLIVDVFYRYQVVWFGDEATPLVVLTQVVVDQFVYNPVLAAPLTVWLYDWRNLGYRIPKGALSFTYYNRHIIPTLIAGWAVWIPVVSVLYTLPEPLQIPLFSLALSLWVLIYTWMSEERAR